MSYFLFAFLALPVPFVMSLLALLLKKQKKAMAVVLAIALFIGVAICVEMGWEISEIQSQMTRRFVLLILFFVAIPVGIGSPITSWCYHRKRG